MIKKYVYGVPFETEATVMNMKVEEGAISYLTQEDDTTFSYHMQEEDIVYGLGENMRGINKRGWLYASNCSDDPNHEEGKHSLYAAHNFLIVDGKEKFGLFVDFPGKVEFDIGYQHLDSLEIRISDVNFTIYVIEGKDVNAIVKNFRKLIGRSYIPPRWAFGFGQSRWSYMNEDEIRDVVRQYRDNHIPLDSVYMDIDYMERYKDFTINQETFPDFPEFVQEMKEANIHLVPIIDAGVKIEEGYDVYEEGVAKNYFCKDAEGKDFVTAVWPGRTYFPDVLQKAAREWFGQKYEILIKQGIDGFWNDMNEPAIFYSEKHLQEVFAGIDALKGKNLELDVWREFCDLIYGIQNNETDYQSFYHNVDGKMIRHDKVHNLFGYNMTRAAGEAFDTIVPDKRLLLFSRSSYIGMHRYGGIWTGDNKSYWSHLLLNIQMMPSLNMCGILYTGADLGGFGSDVTEDLMARWLAFGIFTPLMRNHAAFGTRRQEIYQFDQKEMLGQIIRVRYRLLPYLYSEFMKASLHDEMMFRPLAFDYGEDRMARTIENQLLVGESIMVTPVYEQNAQGRNVYLPEEMKLIYMGGKEDLEGQVMGKGWHYIEVPLNCVPIFIRPDKILPLSQGGECVEDVDYDNLQLVSFVKNGAEYTYYQDNGYDKDYENPEHNKVLSVGLANS